MSELAKVAMGLIPADCVFQGGKLVNVLTGEIYKTNIAVKGERIAAVGDVNHTIGETTKVYDANGMFITPGLIDGHIHIESSMLTIEEFSRLVVPHGTTSVSADFHEVANVLGLKGLRLFHKISGKVLLRVFLVAPSSVPLAYNIEIPSVHLNLEDIEEIMKWDRVLGLGEILNVHDLISESKELNKKIQLAIKYGKFIDGNAPGIGKKELNAYIASGPQHDHEAVSTDEAKERLRLGMWVMIREGSSERNLADLIEIVNEKIDTRRCCFATDDKSPCDLAIEGHLDHCVRKSIELGVDPVKAIQMATINCAEYMGLERELGSVAPGKLADFIIVDDLKKFNVRRTIIGGRVVAENGKPLFSPEKVIYPKWATNTFRLKRIIKPSDLEIKADCRKNVKVRLIDVTEGTITSKASEATMFVQNNKLVSDIERDILKIVVVERYGKTNIAIGKGFIRGFGLQHGAL
ncbi:MAG: amidohydrolase family protein, partial [Candidatus Bathyarchaeia archaeon]